MRDTKGEIASVKRMLGRSNDDLPKSSVQSEPVAEYIEDHPNFVDRKTVLRDQLSNLVKKDAMELIGRNKLNKNNPNYLSIRKLKKQQVTARALNQKTGEISDAFQNVDKIPDEIDSLLRQIVELLEKLEPITVVY